MEEKQGKGNQVLLTVLGIATLLVAVVGATFAYFSASSVSGNVSDNNINATAAQYGNTWVTYAEGIRPIIDVSSLDLPKTQAGQNYQWLVKFTVSTTATTAQNITVSWNNVNTNTFCAYQVGSGMKCSESATAACMKDGAAIETTEGNCTAAGGTWTTTLTNTSRLDEFTYELYSCTSEGYNGTSSDTSAKTVTVGSGCTAITNSGAALSTAMPRTAATSNLHSAANLAIAASANGTTEVTNYYALVVQITNRADTSVGDGTGVQDYNQARSFQGAFVVGVVAR